MAALPATHDVQRHLQPVETDLEDYGYTHAFRTPMPPGRWLDDYLWLCIKVGKRTRI